MSNDNALSGDILSAMLSKMSVDNAASVIAKATIGDCSLPMDATLSLLNLVSTISMMMSPTDRASIVCRMRDVCDLIEADMFNRQ